LCNKSRQGNQESSFSVRPFHLTLKYNSPLGTFRLPTCSRICSTSNSC
jgi:hypothetical protein